MFIKVDNIAKKFQQNKIFQHFSFEFHKGDTISIVGGNGMGKSTLLQCLSSSMMVSQGRISYFLGEREVPKASVFQYMSFCAPYVKFPEKLTVEEAVTFYHTFSPLEMGKENFLKKIGLGRYRKNTIEDISSGVFQKLKLALTYYSHKPLILLDEPTSFLDSENLAWYHSLFSVKKTEKLLIIASNHPPDYDFCNKSIDIEKYSVAQHKK